LRAEVADVHRPSLFIDAGRAGDRQHGHAIEVQAQAAGEGTAVIGRFVPMKVSATFRAIVFGSLSCMAR
jgi:hypothetical protein